MRALIIGPEEREAAAKVVAYAQEPQHWYRLPASGDKVPGNDPAFVVEIQQGYRCVFTFTENNGGLFRHLTVSVDGPLYPSVEAVVEIARLFGFTGPTDDEPFADIKKMMLGYGWLVSLGHPGEHCIVVAQRLEEV